MPPAEPPGRSPGWQQRHATAGHWPAGTRPQPPELLDAHRDRVPSSGRALDVACGRGLHAVWLAERGLTVDAVDLAPAGLAAGAALAARRGVGARVCWIEHDLDTGLPAGTGRYELIVCRRFRAPWLYPALADALAPGGLLAVTVLSEVDAGPGRFRAPAGELVAAFAGLEILEHTERAGLAALLVSRGPSHDARHSRR